MSDAIKGMISKTAKGDYTGFSEFVESIVDEKMKNRLSEETSAHESSLFEMSKKYDTDDSGVEQDGPRDEFNDKSAGDERKSDKGGKKVKNKMKTEEDDDDSDDEDMDEKKSKKEKYMKKEQDDDDDDSDDDDKDDDDSDDDGKKKKFNFDKKKDEKKK